MISFFTVHTTSLQAQKGATLLALIVAMALTLSALGWGMSHYQHRYQLTALNVSARQLSDFIQQAAVDAHLQQQTLVLCDIAQCGTDWARGLSLRTKANLPPIASLYWPTNIKVNGPAHRLYFTPRAFDSGANGTFLLCSTAPAGRRLIFNRLGQVRYDAVASALQACQRRGPRQG